MNMRRRWCTLVSFLVCCQRRLIVAPKRRDENGYTATRVVHRTVHIPSPLTCRSGPVEENKVHCRHLCCSHSFSETSDDCYINGRAPKSRLSVETRSQNFQHRSHANAIVRMGIILGRATSTRRAERDAARAPIRRLPHGPT